MDQLPPLRWVVQDPEARRQLLWFCSDPQQAAWVEPLRPETLDNAAEIMAKVLVAITEHCGAAGEIRFGDDPTQYTLRRVELRTNGALEKVTTFSSELVRLNPRILVRLVTLVANRSSDVPSGTIERHFVRGTTLEQALQAAEKIAQLAQSNAGYVILEDDQWYHLDRVEVYYDGQFTKVFMLDYSSIDLDGE